MNRKDFIPFKGFLSGLSQREYRDGPANTFRLSDFTHADLPAGEVPRVTFGLTEFLMRCCRWTAQRFPEAIGFYGIPVERADPHVIQIGWHHIGALPISEDELIRLMIESGEFPEQNPTEGQWSSLLYGLNTCLQHHHPRIARKEISFYWPGDLKDAVPRLTQWQEAGHLRIDDELCGTDPGDLVIEMVSYIPG